MSPLSPADALLRPTPPPAGRPAVHPGKPADPAAAIAAAREFEAVFLGQMIKPMFQTLDTDPPFGGGFAEGVWRDVLADEVGRAVAAAGGIGIADSVARELLRAQEAAAATTTPGDQP